MNPDGPYVAVAALCESVLHEKDEKISCIRFIDVIKIQVISDDPSTAVRLKVNAFLSFKSGAFVGTKLCSVKLISPSGKEGKLGEGSPKAFPMEFTGGEYGSNLIMAFDLPIVDSGLYWFDVMLDDEVYTRIPLKVKITRLPSQKQLGNSHQAQEHLA